ncbi:MAG: tail fiber domain-containing protein [Acidobacteria bacterium]|nr:tail fiber domain-containing protein [Acidobacteriota bacterium]
MHTRNVVLAVVVLLAGIGSAAVAQPLGTFRWQLRPFCNVVTLAVTQNGAVYRLEGTDDQCGSGADAASVTGTAFPNADGTIGFGLNIVTAPGGRPVHVDAEITVGSFGGTWRDSAGGAGTFAFTPGASSGGSPRPLPSTGFVMPTAIVARQDGGFVAGGEEAVGTIPASGPGVRMMWYPGKAAFRAGSAGADFWDDPQVGFASVAFGTSTKASNNNSVAMGLSSSASGAVSTALGGQTIASGAASTAMGAGSTASGGVSVAMGERTVASELATTAMGSFTTASGTYSTAMGLGTRAEGSGSTAMGRSTSAAGLYSLAGGDGSGAGGHMALAFGDHVAAAGNGSVALGTNASAFTNGSFVFADRSIQTGIQTQQPGQFLVRATGGVEFYSNAAATLGVRLAPNGAQWLALSDVRTKHRFRTLDGDEILAKIAAMPVTEWSYTAQEAGIRHIGPTAQDFHAAFGLGEDPLRIGTLDADGVALAGVRALEARSRTLRDDQDALGRRVAALEQALADALELVRALKGGR